MVDQWEYCTLSLLVSPVGKQGDGDDFKAWFNRLNAFGRDGWEAVGMITTYHPGANDGILLKRRLTDQRPSVSPHNHPAPSA